MAGVPKVLDVYGRQDHEEGGRVCEGGRTERFGLVCIDPGYLTGVALIRPGGGAYPAHIVYTTVIWCELFDFLRSDGRRILGSPHWKFVIERQFLRESALWYQGFIEGRLTSVWYRVTEHPHTIVVHPRSWTSWVKVQTGENLQSPKSMQNAIVKLCQRADVKLCNRDEGAAILMGLFLMSSEYGPSVLKPAVFFHSGDSHKSSKMRLSRCSHYTA